MVELERGSARPPGRARRPPAQGRATRTAPRGAVAAVETGDKALAERVLITGGAGFIGRYVARALVARGHEVRVLDSMIEQVHQGRRRPDGLPKGVEFIAGDVRDETAVLKALKVVDAGVHLAAEVGVGDRMYAVDRYVFLNDSGTEILFV